MEEMEQKVSLHADPICSSVNTSVSKASSQTVQPDNALPDGVPSVKNPWIVCFIQE
jgi:hypothetical protein